MTPVAPASAQPPPPKTARRASASQRSAPARRRKLPGSPRGPVPRRVSGPVAAPATQPRPQRSDRRLAPPQRSDRQVPRRRTARKPALSARLAAFLRSLPDHPLLDRLVRGRAWIPVLGVMLVGIVAMQVELLKLNADTGRSIELIGSLQSRNDLLRAQVGSASDPNRIERLASRMGMTMPSPESITFVEGRSASARRALARIRVPDLAAFEAALRASNAASTLPTPTPTATATPSAPAPANGTGQGTNGTLTGGGSSASASTGGGSSTSASTGGGSSTSASSGPSSTGP